MLTQEELKDRLLYDPDTGEFHWNSNPKNGDRIGARAGCIGGPGRWMIRLNGNRYYAYRLAWLYVTGNWPPFEIDHKDRNPLNDKFSNLRPATKSKNSINKPPHARSGVKWVYWSHEKGKWRVSAKGHKHLGYFNTLLDAASCSISYRNQCHGEFSYENSK